MVMWYLIASNEYLILKHRFYFRGILCLYVHRYVLMCIYIYTRVNKAVPFTRSQSTGISVPLQPIGFCRSHSVKFVALLYLYPKIELEESSYNIHPFTFQLQYILNYCILYAYCSFLLDKQLMLSLSPTYSIVEENVWENLVLTHF
jgi:hypothetical protein